MARPDEYPRRRREDQAWTVGEHDRFEGEIGARLDVLERKVDRLTWMVATGCGILAAAGFLIGLILPYLRTAAGA